MANSKSPDDESTEPTEDEAERMFNAGEGLTEDLDLYLPCAIRAVRRGVARVHLIDHDKDGGDAWVRKGRALFEAQAARLDDA